MKSYGFELELNWRDRIGEVSYGAKLVLSDDQQKILRYPNDSYDVGSYYKGRHLNDIWGLTTIGIAKTQEEMDAHLAKVDQSSLGTSWGAGDIMYADLDGDGKISNGTNKLGDTGDYRIIGNSTPRLKYGLTLDAAWKGFDFSMTWSGATKVSRLLDDIFREPFGATDSRSLMKYMIDDMWTPEKGNSAKAPAISFTNKVNNYRDSDLWLRDASYLRLKNVEIGYNFPKKILSKINIGSLRVFATGYNLLTLDKLKIVDPESRPNGNAMYPVVMVINMGLKVGF